MVNAPDVRVRRKACEVARALPSPRAVAPLARDPRRSRRRGPSRGGGGARSSSFARGRRAAARSTRPPDAGRTHPDHRCPRAPGPRETVVPLVGKVEDSSPDVRQAVVRALGDRGRAGIRRAGAGPPVSKPTCGATRSPTRAHAPRRTRSTSLRFSSAIVPRAAAGRAHRSRTDRSSDGVRVLVAALGTHDDDAGALQPTPARDALVAAGAVAIPSLRALLAGSPYAADRDERGVGARRAARPRRGARDCPGHAQGRPAQRRRRCTRSPVPERARTCRWCWSSSPIARSHCSRRGAL